MSIKQRLNQIKQKIALRARAYASPVVFIIFEIVIGVMVIIRDGMLPGRWAYYFLFIGAIINLIACIKEDLHKNEEAECLEIWYKVFYVLFVFGDFLQRMLYTIFGG